MKITEMLQREDFYEVNAETLADYYAGAKEAGALYIYPHLNAIVTASPDKAVTDYLLTEYDIRGNRLKRWLTRAYVRLCMASCGLLAARRVHLPHTAHSKTLIYPCNRKYRIFDFEANTVSVHLKSGFPGEQLKHEIEFRSRTELPSFVPTMVSHQPSGYTENIIDGRPLARVSQGYEAYKQAAYEQLSRYAARFNRLTPTADYVATLAQQLVPRYRHVGLDIDELLQGLCRLAEKQADITLTFSHGDLQAGNIWLENGSDTIFIIDWESWGIRSSFYDKAVLFDGLRPGGVDSYLLNNNISLEEKALVLLEDLDFQCEEYESLPEEFGKNKLQAYSEKLKVWLQTNA